LDRPNVEAILAPLKPFQRRTVEHAFHRLFKAPDSTARFLVADEVGLGKTLVPRGIIARAIEYMWDDVERIDIVYICSNQNIARANLPKLHVSGEEERSYSLATRLTMLATEMAPREGEPGVADSKLNFVSFTPGTSFNMGHSAGKADERRVLFHLLAPLVERRKRLMNLCQGWVTKTEAWRYKLDHDPLPVEFEGINNLTGLGISIHAYGDEKDQTSIFDRIIQERIRQGFAHEDIVIVSMRGYDKSVFFNTDSLAGIPKARPSGAGAVQALLRYHPRNDTAGYRGERE